MRGISFMRILPPPGPISPGMPSGPIGKSPGKVTPGGWPAGISIGCPEDLSRDMPGTGIPGIGGFDMDYFPSNQDREKLVSGLVVIQTQQAGKKPVLPAAVNSLTLKVPKTDVISDLQALA